MKLWIGLICAVLIGVGIYYGVSVSKSSETAVLRYYEEHVMSTKDTRRLKELLSDSSEWFESDETCIYIQPYELKLGGMKYQIDLSELDNPIRYGKINGEYTGSMDTENEDIKLEIYRTASKWSSLKYSYEWCLENYSKKTTQATVYERGKEDSEGYTLSREDTSRLRKILSLESGWYDDSPCQCIGDYVLVLDNIRYIVDISSVDHQIKYGNADGYSSYSCAIINDDKEIVSEVYKIVENAVH